MVVYKASFQNCLIVMRPWATSSDFPSSHDMKVYLHNKCVEWLKDLKNDILMSQLTARSTLYSLNIRQCQERF